MASESDLSIVNVDANILCTYQIINPHDYHADRVAIQSLDLQHRNNNVNVPSNNMYIVTTVVRNWTIKHSLSVWIENFNLDEDAQVYYVNWWLYDESWYFHIHKSKYTGRKVLFKIKSTSSHVMWYKLWQALLCYWQGQQINSIDRCYVFRKCWTITTVKERV